MGSVLVGQGKSRTAVDLTRMEQRLVKGTSWAALLIYQRKQSRSPKTGDIST